MIVGEPVVVAWLELSYRAYCATILYENQEHLLPCLCTHRDDNRICARAVDGFVQERPLICSK